MSARTITREDVARLIDEYQVISELIASMQAQLSIVNDSIEEIKTALDGLRSLSQDSERYVHIGAGVYLKASVDQTEVLTPLGASYYAFLDRQNAERILNERLEELNNVKSNLEANLSKLGERAAQIRSVLERLGVVG
ncbi:prefoldin subunit alpha [Thermoproteus uzoniensis 768-20]|uniref:Prefoldin subunit alpha n=1 Tax=Thermoproteus uzoniensis (strain 768-20) TaxID=999630 RepID=F2L325_THEU7|nr:prefoldin subunit alpha [Thermoproteus uzoniensis]AEA13144.1 prefoldin subunit alpha [Thermoproteus uzoniensis 768-20]